MRVLSIDQSLTNCGLIVWEDGLIYDFKSIQSNKDLEDHIRIAYLVENIVDIIRKDDIEVVVLEGLSFGSISTSVRPLAGLYYAILMACYYEDIEYQDFTPSSIKKFATGSGKAKKKDMWEALPENIRVKIEHSPYKTIAKGKYDITDAYWIGQKYYEELS